MTQEILVIIILKENGFFVVTSIEKMVTGIGINFHSLNILNQTYEVLKTS
ncbi:MAG TPA: hypothetical protein VGI43_19410 [Mucilaginibacter sp.]